MLSLSLLHPTLFSYECSVYILWVICWVWNGYSSDIFLLALIVSIFYVKILLCSNVYRLENWFWMRAILKTGGFSNIFMPPIFSCWILLSLIAMDNCYLFSFAYPLKIYLVQYRKELIFKNELWTHCIKLHKSRSFSLF